MDEIEKSWFDNQSADVRAELGNLIDYRPEPEFILLLSKLLPMVPCRGLIDLYYDIWYCVPVRLAFRIAVRQLHHPEELAEYLALTERVLVDLKACDAFSEQLNEDSDVDEVLFWLKRRAR
jgi:hypothetical protein